MKILNAFTDDERTKLEGIEDGAEVNVQSDWNQTDTGADDYIKNKPSAGTGDMEKITYDPTLVEADVFDMDNMNEGTTNKIFSDTERTKLTGIEDGAEVNPSASEIKILYESNADTNAFTDAEQTKVINLSGTNTGDVTLNSSDTTQETLDLTGQEVTVNAVTTTTDGAMIAEDKLKLDNISSNGAGDSWVSGLEITENSPKNQKVAYGNGTYLINGILKSIATSGIYDLENGFGGVNHYTGMTSYQHKFVAIYVDGVEVIKSLAGPAAEKNDIPDIPLLPADTVCLAFVEIRVDSGANPKDIDDKKITDCRKHIVSTDEFVKVSADDTDTGHLFDKLSNAGNVTFTIVNAGGNEQIKADASGGGGTLPSITYTTDANIDGVDVSSLAPHGILYIDISSNREFRSVSAGIDGQKVTVINLGTNTIKAKNETGTYQQMRTEGGTDKTFGDFGGFSMIYNSSKGYWYMITAI